MTRWTSFFLSRRRDWEQAFASLYYGLLAKKKKIEREHSSRLRRRRRRKHDEGKAAVVDGDLSRDAEGGGGGVDREGFYLQCPRFTVHWRLVEDDASTDGR